LCELWSIAATIGKSVVVCYDSQHPGTFLGEPFVLSLLMPAYFVTCSLGMEPILADELRALDAHNVRLGRGGVSCEGDRRLLYRANLWLRTAVRVLQPLFETPVQSTDELYDAVGRIDWDEYLTPDHTLAVDCNVRDSAITHSQYAARRVKDAICDQFRAKTGRRPSVDTERPMVGLNLHISRDLAILSLDSSWDSLHKRGYRPKLNKAPLNEALAAGLIYSTGWRHDQPFVDPLCGSGTLPIEAAWMALHRPPGLTRKHFGFMGWMDYDIGLWADVRDEARDGVGKYLPAVIQGSDVRADAIQFCETNARAAGIGHLLQFAKQDLANWNPPAGPPGVWLCNPPYGERIGEMDELVPLYRLIGEVIATRCRDWTCWVFTSNKELGEEIGLKPYKSIPWFNGKLTCKLMGFRGK